MQRKHMYSIASLSILKWKRNKRLIFYEHRPVSYLLFVCWNKKIVYFHKKKKKNNIARFTKIQSMNNKLNAKIRIRSATKTRTRWALKAFAHRICYTRIWCSQMQFWNYFWRGDNLTCLHVRRHVVTCIFIGHF